MSSIISDLHLKFAQKTWNETFQLVRRCMVASWRGNWLSFCTNNSNKAPSLLFGRCFLSLAASFQIHKCKLDKYRDVSQVCEPVVKSLERLQEVLSASSINTVKSRLEMIARKQGMGFHTTEATCYLTADLFYLEVVLLPCGGVEDVKVAQHGGSPLPSKAFLQLLRAKHFEEFSMKLAGLFTQYNIPGDNDHKFKLFTSLQCLWQDLQQISNMLGVPKDTATQVDLINNGKFGCLIAGKEDIPLTIQFYIRQTDRQKISDLQMDMAQTAQVTVGSSYTSYKLQAASLLPQHAQLDPQGGGLNLMTCGSHPVFLPLNEVPHESMQATFLLKLHPAIPTVLPFVSKLSQITGMNILEFDLQWAPLPKLLMQMSAGAKRVEEETNEQDAVFTVPLPSGVTHRYILPGAAWEVPAQRGTLLETIPFTHPAHIPALLELLRHQSTINTLLKTCVTSQHARPGLVCDLHYEVLPESETSFSVTLHRPDADSLAVLLVNISDSHQISCTLFGAGLEDPSLNEYLSNVMKWSMSIPVALSELHSKLEKIPPVPLSPCRQATPKVKKDLSPSPCSTGTDTSSTLAAFSQRTPVTDEGLGVSGSDCYATSVAKSEPLPEINTCANFSLYPFSPVGVFPQWMTNTS